MRFLRNFNESSKYPLYKKGELILFTKNRISLSTAKDIAKSLGYDLEEGPHGDKTFIVYCEPGQEKTVGSAFVDNYPEFFDSWERRDLRLEYIYDKVDGLKSKLDSIINYFEYSDNRKFIDSEKFNNNIDSIISELQKMKI